MRLPLLLLLACLTGCLPVPKDETTPDPNPVTDDPTTEELTACERACKHVGPDGLGCEYGEPVYDSDVEGERGVPNTSCAVFCAKQEANGLEQKPECIAKVGACSEIDEVMNEGCD